MVITPTVTLTGTYVLWVAEDGTDVGTFAVGVLQGIMVLLIVLMVILGQYLAWRVWP